MTPKHDPIFAVIRCHEREIELAGKAFSKDEAVKIMCGDIIKNVQDTACDEELSENIEKIIKEKLKNPDMVIEDHPDYDDCNCDWGLDKDNMTAFADVYGENFDWRIIEL